MKSGPWLALLAFAVLFVGFLGFSWLQQPPSNQELLANYAKVADYVNTGASVRGLPWWTPNFLQGCSLAFLSLGALSSLTLYACAAMVGPFTGVKIAALVFLLLCPLTMFSFVRRLCPSSPWTAFSCGVAYALAPAVLLRLGHVEHVANVLGFAALPLVFRGVLVFLEERTARAAVMCAATSALLTLSYAKVAVLVLPLLVVFACWTWIARARFYLPAGQLVLLCLGVFFILGVLPNLPSFREAGWVAMFDFGPFEAWQRGYSAESIISWIDREGFLTGRQPSAQSDVRASSSYMGLLGLACVTGLFFLRKRDTWLSLEAEIFRLFLALTLLAHWLGLGANTALSGHFAFLAHAGSAWDPAIAIAWGLLVLQGVAIWYILPSALPGRPWIATVAIIVYFCVPGFRIIENLPLYADIRAPHDFFEMGGTFCFSVAGGVAARLLLQEISARNLRVGAAVALLGLAWLDSVSSVPSFFRGPIDRQTFDDFLAAQRFLSERARPGRVAPYSGRYFYLLTPILSGRPIIAEAFNSHLMLRGVAELQRASLQSRQSFTTFLNIAGVSQIFIDKKDPDTPQSLQEFLRSVGTPVFENEHFLILDNSDSLYPAAFSKYFIDLNETPEEIAARSLAAAAAGSLVVSARTRFGDSEGLISSEELRPATPMRKVSPDAVQRRTAEAIEIDYSGEVGWLIIPEAYHRDWTALRSGHDLELAKAYGALLAIRLDGKPGRIALSFKPPWWYFASVWTALAGWLGAIGVLTLEKMGLISARWQTRWWAAPRPQSIVLTPASNGVNKDAPARVLAIIPTYNEASGIESVLNKVLNANHGVEMIVIDDNSPDQTAQVVRAHRAFGRRVHLLQREGKLGLGSAYKEGFRWAIERGSTRAFKSMPTYLTIPTTFPACSPRSRMEPMWPSARDTPAECGY